MSVVTAVIRNTQFSLLALVDAKLWNTVLFRKDQRSASCEDKERLGCLFYDPDHLRGRQETLGSHLRIDFFWRPACSITYGANMCCGIDIFDHAPTLYGCQNCQGCPN